MSGPLPPYSDESATCLPCAYDEADTEFMPKAVGVDPERLSVRGAPLHGAFLKRTCRRCGYTWAEACVNTP